LSGLPSFSHWANVNGFIVDPVWKPPAPFRSLPCGSFASTLKFRWVSNLPGSARNTVFCAIARIFPLPGWTDTRAAPHRSGLGPAVPSTCDWAAACSLLSRVVVMVRPPR
jgi:hypothetical protein